MFVKNVTLYTFSVSSLFYIFSSCFFNTKVFLAYRPNIRLTGLFFTNCFHIDIFAKSLVTETGILIIAIDFLGIYSQDNAWSLQCRKLNILPHFFKTFWTLHVLSQRFLQAHRSPIPYTPLCLAKVVKNAKAWKTQGMKMAHVRTFEL